MSASRSHASFPRLFTQPFSCVWLYLLLFCLWPDNYSAVISMHIHTHARSHSCMHMYTQRHACVNTPHMDTYVGDMCRYMHTNAHILIHKCTYVYIDVYTWHRKMHNYICTGTHKDTCTHAHVYMHTYTINTHAYISIHMQRCTQMCTHTCTYMH